MKPNLTYKTVTTIDLLDISHRELSLIWDALNTSRKEGAYDVWDQIDELILSIIETDDSSQDSEDFVRKQLN